MSLRSNTITVDNKTISFLIGGDGPCLLFLHGYMETKEVWIEFVNSFLPNYTVIIPDLPGHGQTPCDSSINTMENMAEHVNLLLIGNSINKAIIIGHSMGGYVSLALLPNYTALVKGLVLLNSLSIADNTKKIRERLKEIDIIEKGKKNLLIKFGIPNSYLFERKKLFIAQINNQIKFAQKILSLNLITTIHGLNARKDQSELLLKSNIPYIIVHGKNDTVLSVHPLEIEKQIHRNNFLWIDDCAHICFVEQKLKTQKIIFEFIRKIAD